MTSQAQPEPGGSIHVDQSVLAARLASVAQAEEGALLKPSLQRVAVACQELFGVDGAGIMLTDEAGELHYVVATDDTGRRLEDVQIETGEGPCIDAFATRGPITSEDLDGDVRWPMVRVALRGSHIHGVLGVPLQLNGAPVGTLNLYRSAPTRWGDDVTAALVGFADVAEQLMRAAVAAERAGELAAQLTYALEYRAPIERAVGFLMARQGLTQPQAFELLRTTARSTRRRIGDVATGLLATGRLLGPGSSPVAGAGKPRTERER